jgi:glycosyltransferase involved in cell wall biosynthesis
MTDNRRLKILTVCSATRGVYGAVQSMLTLADAEISAGHTVEFITRKGKPFHEELIGRGYKARNVSIRTKIDPIAIVQMAQIARKRKVDIIHCHLSTASVNGSLAGRLARIPAIATVHGLSGKLSFVGANHIIAVSQMVKNHLVDQGIHESKVSVVYNGIPAPTNLMTQAEAKKALGLSSSTPVIGTVSRVTANKGIEYAILAIAEIAKHYPKLKYLVIGDGDALNATKALVLDCGIANNVVFAGYQSDVYSYLSAMDIMLFPSLQEAMGMALVEAFLADVAVVGTNVGGIPEVVSEGCGITVPPMDAPALTEATLHLLSNPAERNRLTVNAHHKASSVFGVDVMLSRSERIYRGLLGEGPALPLEPEYGFNLEPIA